MRANFNPLNKSQKFKWFSSTNNNFVSSLIPASTGLLNLNAQPSVHVIHQRLQELKRTEAAAAAAAATSSSSSVSTDTKNKTQNYSKQHVHQTGEFTIPEVITEKSDEFSSSHNKVVEVHDDQPEKPQIDLNEFLQQIGILKRDDDHQQQQPDGSRDHDHDHSISSFTESGVSLKDDRSIAHLFGDTSSTYNWDTLGAITGIEDHHEAAAEASRSFAGAYNVNDELMFSSSIWNF